MRFNLKDDDLTLAYANAHVARVIPSTGYNKTIENISDSNVNLQYKISKKMGYIWDFCELTVRAEID